MKWHFSLTRGTLTGTTFCLIPNLFWHDILKTIILATIGALVSFAVTWALQKTTEKKHKQTE